MASVMTATPPMPAKMQRHMLLLSAGAGACMLVTALLLEAQSGAVVVVLPGMEMMLVQAGAVEGAAVALVLGMGKVTEAQDSSG